MHILVKFFAHIFKSGAFVIAFPLLKTSHSFISDCWVNKKECDSGNLSETLFVFIL